MHWRQAASPCTTPSFSITTSTALLGTESATKQINVVSHMQNLTLILASFLYYVSVALALTARMKVANCCISVTETETYIMLCISCCIIQLLACDRRWYELVNWLTDFTTTMVALPWCHILTNTWHFDCICNRSSWWTEVTDTRMQCFSLVCCPPS